jgi:hypothetical protein
MNEDLRSELLATVAEDEAVPAKLASDGSLFDGDHPTMQAAHDKNVARLTEIVDQHGWPGRSLVGEDGSRGVARPPTRDRPPGPPAAGSLAVAGRARGAASAVEIAMLEDRIRFSEGRPQEYGTPYDGNEDGELSPPSIEDEDRVDERRREVGLPHLTENRAHIREGTARDGEKPPSDWMQRQRKFLEWARSVGWRKSSPAGGSGQMLLMGNAPTPGAAAARAEASPRPASGAHRTASGTRG